MSDAEYYRGITLLSALGKLFTRVVNIDCRNGQKNTLFLLKLKQVLELT